MDIQESRLAAFFSKETVAAEASLADISEAESLCRNRAAGPRHRQTSFFQHVIRKHAAIASLQIKAQATSTQTSPDHPPSLSLMSEGLPSPAPLKAVTAETPKGPVLKHQRSDGASSSGRSGQHMRQLTTQAQTLMKLTQDIRELEAWSCHTYLPNKDSALGKSLLATVHRGARGG